MHLACTENPRDKNPVQTKLDNNRRFFLVHKIITTHLTYVYLNCKVLQSHKIETFIYTSLPSSQKLRYKNVTSCSKTLHYSILKNHISSCCGSFFIIFPNLIHTDEHANALFVNKNMFIVWRPSTTHIFCLY